MTEAEYRELIQTFVDQPIRDQRVAELLAAEARQGFGVEIDPSGDDE